MDLKSILPLALFCPVRQTPLASSHTVLDRLACCRSGCYWPDLASVSTQNARPLNPDWLSACQAVRDCSAVRPLQNKLLCCAMLCCAALRCAVLCCARLTRRLHVAQQPYRLRAIHTVLALSLSASAAPPIISPGNHLLSPLFA